jgi:hypothetical protein
MLYTVDYSEDWNKTKSVFMSELSFTILSWKIVENIINLDNFDFSKVDSRA